jgi:hypothetical protein
MRACQEPNPSGRNDALFDHMFAGRIDQHGPPAHQLDPHKAQCGPCHRFVERLGIGLHRFSHA